MNPNHVCEGCREIQHKDGDAQTHIQGGSVMDQLSDSYLTYKYVAHVGLLFPSSQILKRNQFQIKGVSRFAVHLRSKPHHKNLSSQMDHMKLRLIGFDRRSFLLAMLNVPSPANMLLNNPDNTYASSGCEVNVIKPGQMCF